MLRFQFDTDIFSSIHEDFLSLETIYKKTKCIVFSIKIEAERTVLTTVIQVTGTSLKNGYILQRLALFILYIAFEIKLLSDSNRMKKKNRDYITDVSNQNITTEKYKKTFLASR